MRIAVLRGPGIDFRIPENGSNVKLARLDLSYAKPALDLSYLARDPVLVLTVARIIFVVFEVEKRAAGIMAVWTSSLYLSRPSKLSCFCSLCACI